MEPKVHYILHNSLLLAPNVTHTHPVYTLSPYLRKIHSNIIFLCTPFSSAWSLPFRLSNQNIVCISYLSRACYMPRHSTSVTWPS